MDIEVVGTTRETAQRARGLVGALQELGFPARTSSMGSTERSVTTIELSDDAGAPTGGGAIAEREDARLLEAVLQRLPMDFGSLPLLVEGDSKIVRSWTERVVVEKFKPTVYSYTANRYGLAPGTDRVRMRFTAEVFRRMQLLDRGETTPRSAFLGVLEAPGGPFLVQRRVEPCNLETRIKRFHVGSPVHRYRYTERHATLTAHSLTPWTRFHRPVVCFDWRHPLWDNAGNRLADEPISDDYAGIWMKEVEHAKSMARETFRWLEDLFAERGVLLIDMCIFIDRDGRLIYGEISPDCMRARIESGRNPNGDALDKDTWRDGGSRRNVLEAYERLCMQVFGSAQGGVDERASHQHG